MWRRNRKRIAYLELLLWNYNHYLQEIRRVHTFNKADKSCNGCASSFPCKTNLIINKIYQARAVRNLTPPTDKVQ